MNDEYRGERVLMSRIMDLLCVCGSGIPYVVRTKCLHKDRNCLDIFLVPLKKTAYKLY